jgi:hypothetical protein
MRHSPAWVDQQRMPLGLSFGARTLRTEPVSIRIGHRLRPWRVTAL